MPRAARVCSTSLCPQAAEPGSSRCPACRAAADQRRGTPAERGYTRRHRTRFRPGVLRKHPFCACDRQDCKHHPGRHCVAPSTVADHHPLSRRELVAAGLDPDDPKHGRGLCSPCHNAHTARAQPGGWNA